jgi:long-chain acyl-CoA synthetase
VVPLPLYHVFALTSMLCFVHIGAHIVLVTDPRDIDGFIKVLAHARMTVLIGVNTLFKALLEAPNTGRIDGSALKAVIAGGMALQHGVADQWQQRFGATLIEGYGLTEASPFVCANPLGQRAFNGMIGLPLPSTEVSILNELGEPVALGELGEICVRGPQLMQAYWKMPQESANVFTLSGALRTGDLGTMDEHGYVKLLDRKKDVIIVSGLKVFPNEVEDVIATHPGVHEVVAIGADDEHSGEVVMAVVIKSELSLTADAIIDHCRRNLAPYKVPRYVVFRDKPLPKSNIGKVLRRLVKEEQGMLLRPSPGLNPLMPGATPLH